MKGKDMMKTSTKLIVTGAASLLGIALATGAAYAATGSLTAADAPGRVLQVSGVGLPAGPASATATAAHANANGLSGVAATPMAVGHGGVGQVARPAPRMLSPYHAVMPSMRASVQPAAPQPVSSSPGMTVPARSMR